MIRHDLCQPFVKIMFRVRLSSTLSNESGGFDNIKITARFDCQGRWLDNVQSGGDIFGFAGEGRESAV